MVRLAGLAVEVFGSLVTGVVLGLLGFLVGLLGGAVTVAVGSTYGGLVMVGWIAMVLVVSTTLVGRGGARVGVWLTGSRILIVGLPGRGTGPLTGGAELSVGAAIEGEERVGIILTGGSTMVVGGTAVSTGVGVLFNWRLTRFGMWGFLFAMCHPTTG